ncbi:dioxygenase [Shinella sp.]|uniref:dioxygenase family protein n=1 Tax=Shinella sp. TaxID=1870904 RepID=UPI0029B6E0F0|nr:dioxygenase [Shinella sp.]MDX3975238.1 dioxygenase [Shinella sp.]
MPGPMVSPVDTLTASDAFARRLAAAGDGRLRQALTATVTHLHALITELKPTPAEWRSLIAFLTEVGHAADDRRQEWVLLSDLLGASALVEEVNTRRPKLATPNTVRGPFFRADAPARPLGSDISLDGVGEGLAVSARVQDLDGAPIAGAEVITWQANAAGLYENQQPDLQPEFNLRGLFRTDGEGRFHYRTIRPAGYGVPDDGPVGTLLRKAGLPLRRPAHLHFMIKAAGFETIVTHLYDASDPQLDADALFGVKPELICRFERAADKPCFRLDYTFVMARSKQGAPA